MALTVTGVTRNLSHALAARANLSDWAARSELSKCAHVEIERRNCWRLQYLRPIHRRWRQAKVGLDERHDVTVGSRRPRLALELDGMRTVQVVVIVLAARCENPCGYGLFG